MEQERICQFYIVIGDKEFMPPSDGNVYINATGVLDNKLINASIFKAFNKKSSENIKVGNEIIFLVPDMSFQARCQEIIAELKIRGRIEFMPPKKLDIEIQNNVSENSSLVSDRDSLKEQLNDDSSEKVIEEQNEDLNFGYSVNSNSTSDEVASKTITNYSYKPENNNYGNLGTPTNNVDAREDEVVNNTLTSNKGKSLVRVKKPSSSLNKSAAFVSLPVIMFIISALLLISSIVLLFVLD